MEKIIEKVMQEKLKDGSFEKIVNEQLERMLEGVLNDMVGYGGVARKLLKEKMEPLMNKMIEEYEFDDYAIKLNDTFNEIMKNSNFGFSEKAVSAFDKLLNVREKVKINSKIDIKTIFDKYLKFVESTLDESDVSDILEEGEEDKYCYLPCFMEIEESEKNLFSSSDRLTLTLSNDLAEKNEEIAIKTKIKVDLQKSYDSTYRLDFNTNIPLHALNHLPEFILYLMCIKNQYCQIVVDKQSLADEIELNFEYEYDRY